jgi:hypothetical protein
MPTKQEACQADDAYTATAPQSRMSYLMKRARTHGVGGTLQRLFSALSRIRTGPAAQFNTNARNAPVVSETLHLQAGDLVEVKSLGEILQTLDAGGKCKGLLFMPEMRAFCGKKLRVYKKVERILIETTGELRSMRNTVLLEGSICDGWNGACDRSCFYFWRDAWLRKVERP